MSSSNPWRTVRLLRGIKSMCDALPTLFFNEYCDNSATPSSRVMSCLSFDERHDSLLLKGIILFELSKVTNTLMDSSHGLDGILNSHLRNLHIESKLTLVQEYDKTLNICHIPSRFYSLYIISLKMKNCLPAYMNSYRNITLHYTLRKLLAIILCSRLEWNLQSQNRLSDSQSSFSRPKSSLLSLSSFRLTQHYHSKIRPILLKTTNQIFQPAIGNSLQQKHGAILGYGDGLIFSTHSELELARQSAQSSLDVITTNLKSLT